MTIKLKPINNAITPEKFLEAWRAVWNNMGDEQDDFNKTFRSNALKPWTECMLTGEDAFLKRVANKLGIKHKQEKERKGYHRLDMVFLHDKDEDFPSLFEVMIEHENDRHPENEMWKLIFLRSPLKVIVFYEHDPENKLQEFRTMLRKANRCFPENTKTNYLFIVGALNDDSQINWQFWKLTSNKLPSLQKLR